MVAYSRVLKESSHPPLISATVIWDILCPLGPTSHWQPSTSANCVPMCFLPQDLALFPETREARENNFNPLVPWIICIAFIHQVSYLQKPKMKSFLKSLSQHFSQDLYAVWSGSNIKTLILKLEIYSFIYSVFVENLHNVRHVEDTEDRAMKQNHCP